MGIYFDETLCTLLDMPDLPEGFGVLLFDGFVYPVLHDEKGWRAFNRGSGLEEYLDTPEGRAEAANVCLKEATDKKARTIWKPFFYGGSTSNGLFSAVDHATQALRHTTQAVRFLKLVEQDLSTPLSLALEGDDKHTRENVLQTLDAMRQIIGAVMAYEQHNDGALQELLTRLPQFAQIVRLLERNG